MHVLKTAFQLRLTRRRDYERCESLLASLDFRIMEQGRSPPVEKNKDTHLNTTKYSNAERWEWIDDI